MKHRIPIWIAAALVLALAFFPAPASAASAVDSGGPAPGRCRQVVDRVDGAVKRAQVGNAAWAVVPKMPFLRASRFLAAMGDRAKSPDQVAAWAGRMRALDRKARAGEIAALGENELQKLSRALSVPPDARRLTTLYESCADALLAAGLSEGGFAARLRKQAKVPSEYVFLYRAVGLYPVAAMPVASLTRRAYRTFLSWHRTPPAELPVEGKLTVYAPEGQRTSPVIPGADVLDIPSPTRSQTEALVRYFAPVFVVDRAYPFDRPGAVSLRGGRPLIENGPAVVYYYTSYGFFRGRPALQLNYVIWFGARGGRTAPLIEHGKLDGITFRVTLDPGGRPVAADVMNNCGCYHFFLPAAGLAEGVRKDPHGLQPLVAGRLPENFPRLPLTLRVMAGWHQVDSVWAAPAPETALHYRLVSYDALESLRSAEGRRLFTPSGIARGSGRIEPLLLFSMGIPDVGSMRQRGHHAIKLVGRSHFDDPYLLDETFVWR